MADLEGIMRENVSIPVRDTEPTSGILALPAGNIKRTGVIVAPSFSRLAPLFLEIHFELPPRRG